MILHASFPFLSTVLKPQLAQEMNLWGYDIASELFICLLGVLGEKLI